MSFFSSRRQNESESTGPGERALQQRPSQSVSGPQPIGFETVLGAGSVLEGDLVSSANVRLDGTFTGTLQISGNVLIGETAKINADVNARNISIAGAVRGNVNGRKVQILRTGRVWGDINATALTTEEGAFIDGKISMVSHEAARAAEDPIGIEGEPLPQIETPANAESEPIVVDAPEKAGEDQDEEAAVADEGPPLGFGEIDPEPLTTSPDDPTLTPDPDDPERQS